MARLVVLALTALLAVAGESVNDPCAAIAGKKWVHPAEARACLTAFPVDPVVKANVLSPHKPSVIYIFDVYS